MLISRLTEKDSDLNQREADFFNINVAEKNPDLLADVCDYWLNQAHFQVPRANG